MSIWNDLWEMFFPRYCVVCGKRLQKCEEYLCSSCLSALPLAMSHRQANNEVEKMFWGKFPVQRATAFLYYAKGGDVRSLLYGMKYYGNYRLGCFLGRCMAQSLIADGFFEGVDCLIPVPLHESREHSRGYNQSEALAQGISSVTGIPIYTDVLRRVHSTETQTRKGQYERWLNVYGMFELKNFHSLEGKHVLLIDDVLTTGATMVACADALQVIGNIRISVLALAMAGEA